MLGVAGLETMVVVTEVWSFTSSAVDELALGTVSDPVTTLDTFCDGGVKLFFLVGDFFSSPVGGVKLFFLIGGFASFVLTSACFPCVIVVVVVVCFEGGLFLGFSVVVVVAAAAAAAAFLVFMMEEMVGISAKDGLRFDFKEILLGLALGVVVDDGVVGVVVGVVGVGVLDVVVLTF